METQQQNLIEVKDVYKWFPIKGGLLGKTLANVKAVDGVSLSVKKGETMGLVGESGSGKTTIGRAIMRLTNVTKGEITFDGTDITQLKGRELKPYRRRMQMVFQDPYASLDPRQTIRSTLSEPMKIHHVTASKAESNAAVEKLIETVGLNQDHLSRFPHEFSGGQRQRVAIARALAVNPQFLLLDEPTSSLDVSVQAQILNLLKKLQRDFNLTYLFISHNLSVIRHMCDRVAVMYLGRIVEVGSMQTIYENPKHPYTYALLSSVPNPDPQKRKEMGVLEGDVPSPIDIPSGCRFRTRCPYATNKCTEEFPPLVEIEPGHWI
ncbi:MAG TPA: ABC transporter ATP-binding protein, partial [Nitrospiria bacterium]|nr:ABC transporter ATP-binding protein [Nitrospiria bacterium]